MIALQITSLKQFMNHLLVAPTFDQFDLEEAVISAASTISIDGHVNKEFYQDQPEDSIPAFRPWSELKGLAFDLIKGKRTPLFFRFTLHMQTQAAADLLTRENCDVDPAQVKALVLNIRYDGTNAVLTTGTAFQTFLLSKEPDVIWDRFIQKFLEEKEISYTLL